jgi:hypothetical protein
MIQRANDVFELLKTIGDLGIVKVKPFKDLEASKFKDQVWGIWVLNVGAIQELNEKLDALPGPNSQLHTTKMELMARALYSINDIPLATDEEVKKFNEDTRSDLTLHEYKLLHLGELEEILLKRFDSIYGELLDKQVRTIRGTVRCEKCGKIYADKKENISFYIEFSTSEIICMECSENTSEVLTVQL